MKRIILHNDNVYKGNLILVNRQYGYRAQPAGAGSNLAVLPECGGKVLMERRAATLLDKLMEEIRGWSGIVPVSGWRSMKEQQEIWDTSLAESGREFTEKYVAVPGHSEHQTGLAVDLALKQETIDFICPEFPDSGICQAFRRKAARYGFVERYPAGKEKITGIGYEPWHFRYVGAPHARIMEEHNLTLEEYVDFIREYPWGKRRYFCREENLEFFTSYVKARKDGNTELELPDGIPYSVSGNNVDGFILTEWRKRYA